MMGWGYQSYRQPYEDATMPDSGESCPEGAWHDACNHGSPSKMGKDETERELEELSFSSL
jgi:hypothetical protein